MELILQVASDLINPVTLILCIMGSILGVVLGAIPGLSGGLAITLLLPVTFTMKATTAIPFLLTIYAGSMSGSYIGAILLGIPGTPSSIATVFDGYEFTKQGDPVRALSAASICNFIGTLPGLMIAVFLSPIIAKWAIRLGPWELFSLGFCAIMMVVSLSKGNLAKGLIASGLAIAITTVGASPLCGAPRFTFHSYHLYSGFSLISVLLGIFAGRTILLEYAQDTKSSSSENIIVSRFRWPGKDLLRNIRTIFQSFFIGIWVGILPGLGGALANMMSYATAKNTSKHPQRFGKGCIDGVIAPEVANNAALGGALIPFIALGIPGDMVTALLLGALSIQGVEAGPLIFRNAPEVVYLIFGACIIAAFIILLFQIAGMPLYPKILKIPYHYLYSAIFVICLTGAYTASSNMFDVLMVVIFTLFGVFMAYMDLPTSPFILTFVLSSILENNLRKGASLSAAEFFTRPISLILLLFAVFSTVLPYIKQYISNRDKKSVKS